MTRSLARMALVGLVVLALYALVLLGLAFVPGADIVMPLPISWTGMFAVAVAFAAWNLWDSLLGMRGAVRGDRPARMIAGSFWHLRSDALQGACCTALAGAGALAIVQWGGAEVRTALLTAGGVAIAVNQVWNRLDRERVQRMPGPISEARAMEHLAIALAADARRMGHDVAETLQYPVGVLEMLRIRPGLTEQEVAEIDAAVGQLVALAEHIQALHQQVRAHDPSVRDQPGEAAAP